MTCLCSCFSCWYSQHLYLPSKTRKINCWIEIKQKNGKVGCRYYFAIIGVILSHFMLKFPFYTPTQIPENLWFSVAFRGYRKKSFFRNGLMKSHSIWINFFWSEITLSGKKSKKKREKKIASRRCFKGLVQLANLNNHPLVLKIIKRW